MSSPTGYAPSASWRRRDDRAPEAASTSAMLASWGTSSRSRGSSATSRVSRRRRYSRAFAPQPLSSPDRVAADLAGGGLGTRRPKQLEVVAFGDGSRGVTVGNRSVSDQQVRSGLGARSAAQGPQACCRRPGARARARPTSCAATTSACSSARLRRSPLRPRWRAIGQRRRRADRAMPGAVVRAPRHRSLKRAWWPGWRWSQAARSSIRSTFVWPARGRCHLTLVLQHLAGPGPFEAPARL